MLFGLAATLLSLLSLQEAPSGTKAAASTQDPPPVPIASTESTPQSPEAAELQPIPAAQDPQPSVGTGDAPNTPIETSQPDALPNWQTSAPLEPSATPAESVPDFQTRFEQSGPEYRNRKGKGWWIAAGATTTAMITKQYSAMAICGAPNCEFPGIADRLTWLGITAMSSRAGWMYGQWRARNKAWTHPHSQVIRQSVGWGMAVAGLAGLIADTLMIRACYQGHGPYHQLDGFQFHCRIQSSTAILNLSGAAMAGGFGLAMSAHGYRSALRKRSSETTENSPAPRPKQFFLRLQPRLSSRLAGLSLDAEF